MSHVNVCQVSKQAKEDLVPSDCFSKEFGHRVSKPKGFLFLFFKLKIWNININFSI